MQAIRPNHSEGWNGPKKWLHATSSLAAGFSVILNLWRHPQYSSEIPCLNKLLASVITWAAESYLAVKIPSSFIQPRISTQWTERPAIAFYSKLVQRSPHPLTPFLYDLILILYFQLHPDFPNISAPGFLRFSHLPQCAASPAYDVLSK